MTLQSRLFVYVANLDDDKSNNPFYHNNVETIYIPRICCYRVSDSNNTYSNASSNNNGNNDNKNNNNNSLSVFLIILKKQLWKIILNMN
jgi:hypothetical protein